MQERDELTERVIGAAIEVHRHLGPGLIESAYEECFCYELGRLGLEFERQVALPVIYKGIALDCAYRLDIVVMRDLILELKALERLLPVHSAQLITYLRLHGASRGLLINFGEALLRDGIKRLSKGHPRISDGQE